MEPASLGITNFVTAAASRRAGRSAQDHVKRAIDLVLAALGLAAGGPVILLLGALVRLTSKGPAFYTQKRAGLGGKPFSILKLRTMYCDAEAEGPRWSAPDDPRVTPVGRLLRRAHLDELPQLWNVVRGDMSLVGPRPERPHFVRRLGALVPLYSARLAVKPGITGLAQLRYRSERTIEDAQAKLAYDLEYIKRRSLLLDLRILATTAVRVVAGLAGGCRPDPR